MIRTSILELPFQTKFTNGSQSAVADMPRSKGGAGQGFGPHELLEAALATCLTMTVQIHAERQGLSLTAVNCEVRIDRSVPQLVTLAYSLLIEGDLTGEQLQQLREAASKCPVAQTLTGTIAIQPVK